MTFPSILGFFFARKLVALRKLNFRNELFSSQDLKKTVLKISNPQILEKATQKFFLIFGLRNSEDVRKKNQRKTGMGMHLLSES